MRVFLMKSLRFPSGTSLSRKFRLVGPSSHFVRFAQAVLYRGAGINVVWPDLAIMGALGGVFLAAASDASEQCSRGRHRAAALASAAER